MNKQKLIVVIVSAIGVLSVFLPWANVFFMTVNGLQSTAGVVTLILFGASIAMSLIGNQKLALTSMFKFIIAGCGALIAIMIAMNLYQIKSEMSKLSQLSKLGQDSGLSLGSMTNVGIGFGMYLSLISGVALSACALLIKTPPVETNTKSESQVLDS